MCEWETWEWLQGKHTRAPYHDFAYRKEKRRFHFDCLMAEIVGSAVVGEAVSRLSSLVSGDRSSHAHESVEAKAERLEMAVLKIRSVVAISEQWHITQPPLLHWKAKLKRVAKEGDDILHAHKRQILQSREGSSSAATTTFAKRIIQAGKRFVPFSRKDDDQIHSAVQRFERLADGTDSFFKFVEYGGHPKKPFVLPPLSPRPLLAGKPMEFSLRRGSRDAVILLWPRLNPQVDNRLEAFFMVSYEDDVMWEKNLKMLFCFHVSEATDILGTAMSCSDLLPPQFSAACAAIKGLVAEMIEQDTQYSNPSTKSMWCCHRLQGYYDSECELSKWNRCTDVRSLLPESVIQFGAHCYVSPLIEKSSLPTNDGHPLELVCHISRSRAPEIHFYQYEQVEPHVLGEFLLNDTNGFYHKGTQAWQDRRQLWCSQNSTYLSVTPVLSQPSTLSKLYLMENFVSHSGAQAEVASRKTLSEQVKSAQFEMNSC